MTSRASRTGEDTSWWRLSKRLVLVAAIAVATLLIWQLAQILLLLFASVLVAALLRALAGVIEKYTPIPQRWSVALAVLVVGAVLAGFVWLVGMQIQTQVSLFIESLPNLVRAVEDQIGIDRLSDWLAQQLRQTLEGRLLAVDLATYSLWLVGVAATLLVVLASGVYLALNPEPYRKGLLKLVPIERQEEVSDTLQAAGRALMLWLVGQLAAMVLIGTVTTLGLWLLGVPTPLALGFLAGLLEFVPIVGPIVSAIPAIAVGLAESPSTALWVAGLYLLIQQAEGIFIIPLIHQHTVHLPPVLTIFAILAFGALFGPLGVLLATPLAVVCLVLVKKRWVRETLHEPVDLPGEAGAE